MENRFERFVAREVRFVDNSTHHGPSATASAAQGLSALCGRRYRDAVARLQDAAAMAPNDQEVQFHLALALLQGRRPHRQSREVIAAVRSSAAAAPDLPAARALLALVIEDATLAWRRRPTPPPLLAALVDGVPVAAAALVVAHTSATGAPVYEALRLRIEECTR